VIGKAKNLHLEVIFYLGIQGLVGVPLPIFVELNGIIGTIRLRFQLTPNPPFLRNLTFTFVSQTSHSFNHKTWGICSLP